MMHRAGQRLGNYRLVRLLGRGGFAEVYLGDQIYLHTQAALKVLHVQLLAEHVQAFLKEAQLIAHLKHPQIVQVLDFAVQEGTPFLVMAYAPHGSIRRLYPMGTILDARTMVPYVKDVAEALQFAHDYGLVHRDVKPENMLVGPDKKLLLSDFGLAVVALSSQQQDIVGTVTYMAPEQLNGRSCPASDQYALGIVAYEWLCGAPPFAGTPDEIAAQHVVATPPSLREKNAAISPAVEQVILRALQKDPQQRFPNVSAFATALEQAAIFDESEQETSSLASEQKLSYPARQQQRPLVGREEERALLRRLLFEAEHIADSPGASPISWTKPAREPCAFLVGEAGIGKTRLAEEISHEAHQRGWSVVWSRLYSHECRVPYQLWIEVLRTTLRQGLWGLEAQSEAEAGLETESGSGLQENGRIPSFVQPLAALLPELAERSSPLKETSEHEQLRLWEAVLALLVHICERQPVLLVLDDVHWADSGSCELLGYLIRRLIDYPFLIIGTYREHDLPSVHPLAALIGHLQREYTVVLAHIAQLTDVQISELVAEVPEPFNKYIQHQSAGNPFFAEELARLPYVGVDTHASKSLLPHPLPETITAVLQQRLSKLSSICRQFLTQAAVLGSSFAFSTLHLMANNGNTVLDEESLLAIIDEALQERVLMEEVRGGGSILYHFWHPLLMSHLYETLSATRRALLHRKAAEILCQTYATREAEGAAFILHHLISGGCDSSRVARYAEIAGYHAYALAAYPEAEQYLRIALKYGWECEDEDVSRWQFSHVNRASCRHLAYLLEFLGECTRFQGKYVAARHSFEQALELRASLEVPLSRADLLMEMQLQAMLQCGIGVTWYDVEEGARALQCYQQSEQILELAGIHDGYVWANLSLEQSYVYWRNGFYEVAQDLARRAFELFQDAVKREVLWQDDTPYPTRLRRIVAGDLVNLGRIHALQGMIANSAGQSQLAITYFQNALAISEQHHYMREIGIVCCNLGDVYVRKADHKQAEIFVRRFLEVAEQTGEIPAICIACINLGILAVRSGNLVAATALYRRGLALAEPALDYALISLASTYLALVLQDLGEMKQAGQYIRCALTANRHLKVANCTAPALIACASLRLARFSSLYETCDLGRSSLHSEEIERRTLIRAWRTIERAFSLGELDNETRIEGELVLSRIFLLLGKTANARSQIMRTLDSALQCELMGSAAMAQRILGCVLAAQAGYEQADHYFQQALQQFHRYGMLLEYARTLHCYGRVLASFGAGEPHYQRGLDYLREARSICIGCQAASELQTIESDLIILSDSSTPQHAK